LPELLVALDAFLQAPPLRRTGCGRWAGRVWMACDCGARIAHPFKPAEPLDRTEERR